MKRTGCIRGAAAALLLSGAGLCCGCDRLQGVLDSLGGVFGGATASGKKSALVSDHARVLRRFGEPREKIGVGRKPRTENGISHDRKWNYYYPSRPGAKPVMRTVYFLNDRCVGSVIHQPDGKIRKETFRFSY